jgi:drug/metabolite transporter (DMT)-like permease
MRLLSTVPPAHATPPASASVVLAWLILHEQPSMMELLGIVFVLLGLAAVSGVGARRAGR